MDEAWRQRVKADTQLLRKIGFKPRALMLRLDDILEGNYITYPRFRACGGGVSFHDTDLGLHTVTLEFANYDLGRQAFDQLIAIKDEFEAIAKASYSAYGENRGSLNVVLQKIDSEPEEE